MPWNNYTATGQLKGFGPPGANGADGADGATTLAALTDVNLAGLTNGDMLIWNSGTSKFVRSVPNQSGNFVTIQDYADTRPATPNNGDIVILRDGYFNLIYNSGDWVAFRDGHTYSDPLQYTWANNTHIGTATNDESKGTEKLKVVGLGAAENMMMREMDISALVAPWTITAAAIIDLPRYNYVQCGVHIGDLANDKAITISLLSLDDMIAQYYRQWDLGAMTFNYEQHDQARTPTGVPIWFRFYNDATNIHGLFSVTGDENDWHEVFSYSVTNHLATMDVAGIFVNNYGASQPTWGISINLLSWLIE